MTIEEKHVVDIPDQGQIAPRRVDLRAYSGHASSTCVEGSVYAYLGIPYAQPPLGHLRFRRPQGPAPSWRQDLGPARQSKWQADPMQTEGLGTSKMRPDMRFDEDCLYLNIWTPQRAASGSKRPVLFHIYGGAFVTGGSSFPGYDGARLAHETGCVVVSCNYRLGIFGFLGSRALAAEEPGTGCGNYGFWDCVEALQWTQRNIQLFGGDKSEVTLMGQSAGAIMQSYLFLSDAIPQCLFSRVILQSGVAATVLPRTLASADATFQALAVATGAKATDSDEEKIDALRNADANDLLDTSLSLPARRPRTEYDVGIDTPADRALVSPRDLKLKASGLFGPVWDGVAVPEDFAQRAMTNLPSSIESRNGAKGIMLGCTVDEGTMFNFHVRKRETLLKHASGFHPWLYPELSELYALEAAKDEETFAVCSDYTGASLFQGPIRRAMKVLAQRRFPPAYGYEFAHLPSDGCLRSSVQSEAAFSILREFGVLHCAELPLLWGEIVEPHYTATSDSYGVEADAPKPTHATALDEDSAPGKGFTPAERALSLELMRAVGSFAHGQRPWPALSTSTEPHSIEQIPIRVWGHRAQLGANSPRAVAANRADSEAVDWGDLQGRDTTLGQTSHWKERVGVTADAHAKYRFWAEPTEEGYFHPLLQYYGSFKQGFEE
ncbi:alpha/beta-hydrolase [Ceraceosorus guamensis]|uniref:Carboxylic ester hydrolase n=1 Tax=Ceraceosorus guamensis TaxID=1522189 RepID=A0A316W8F5_9BASI|nr:alpha/beta-hydrolase [Ceraceosorus guamensis]PWN44323.1 alpha/beta-hydrolase [Ceraceosorus guamensis]